MLSLSVAADEMDGAADDIRAGVKRGLRAAARTGFERSQPLVPVDTGALKESGELIEPADGVFSFGYSADHAIPVEAGTEPHPITPDEADALVFKGDDGETVFTTRVNHPGTDPQPFVRPGFEAMAQALRRRGLSPTIDAELDTPL